MSLLSDEDSLDGRSWVEICDAEQALEEKLRSEASNQSNQNGESLKYNATNQSLEEGELSLEEGEILDENQQEKCFKTPTKNYSTKNHSTAEVTPRTQQKTECRTPVSYAKAVRGLISESDRTPTKIETANTDDLSLTSHLDVFHVASPLKEAPKKEYKTNFILDEDTVMYSPCKEKKEVILVKNMKRPFKLIESPKPRQRVVNDNNIRKIAKSSANSDVYSWSVEEIEENIVSGSDDGKERGFASPSLKRELEVNPDILQRRQKQIDYGKNTLGYDRYVKAVPKNKRGKEHPKTPPKHLKMSRRTWDGLIKNWRLKLHRWDPISENDEIDFENANFDQYSFSSDEPSSYDSSSVPSDSTPTTPKQLANVAESEEGNEQEWDCGNNKSECSKELWSDCPEDAKKSNNDEFLGCELLAENCVKAYS